MATAAYLYKCRWVGPGDIHEYQTYSIAGKPLGSKLEMIPAKAVQFKEKAGLVGISAANIFAIEKLETIAARVEYRDYLKGRGQ